jgi:hypothetical protein
MTLYVRQMSAGELVRNGMELYQRNFRVLFLTVLVALIPPNLLFRPFVSSIVGISMFFLLTIFFGFFVFAATTVAISDVCTGNKPSVGRSYQYVFTKVLLRLMLVFLLQSLVVAGGYLLLLIPGLVFSAWYMLAPVVVVLERAEPIAAMKRSRFLGKGFYLRNFGLVFVTVFLIFIGQFMVGFVLGFAMIVLKLQNARGLIEGLEGLLGSALFIPYLYTLLILMYYDLRARREGYDSTALTEDLQR